MISRKELIKARQWREAQGLSVIQLSKLTGWTPAAIHRFENGVAYGADGKYKISERAWNRWKLACAGVEYIVHNKGEYWEHRK